MKCYVLTGGKSSRMGMSKQDLVLDDRTFLDRVCGEASSVFDAVTIVTKADRADHATVRTIHEEATDITAPLLGLLRAAQDSGDDPFFVLAVDYPLITRELISFIRDRAERSDAEIVAPSSGGKVHVLCAAYKPSVRPTLEKKMAKGEYRLQGLIDVHRGDVIPLEELERFGSALLNVNTKEDYERARKIHDEAVQT